MNKLERKAIKNDNGEFELWVNNIYLVLAFRRSSEIELRIQAHDGSPRHFWSEFQQIKNDVVGEHWEAVELYPDEGRLRDPGKPNNMYILWCREKWEVGWQLPRFVVRDNILRGNKFE